MRKIIGVRGVIQWAKTNYPQLKPLNPKDITCFVKLGHLTVSGRTRQGYTFSTKDLNSFCESLLKGQAQNV